MSPLTPGRLAALGALFLAATPAQACPPPPPGYVLPTREQIVRSDQATVPDIFEAVVTRTIRTRAESRRPGELRVTRVYKGNLRVGQRLAFRFNDLWTDCDPLPEQRFAPAGSRGLILLRAPDRGPPGIFRWFEPPAYVEEMRRLGFLPPASPAPTR